MILKLVNLNLNFKLYRWFDNNMGVPREVLLCKIITERDTKELLLEECIV